MKYVVIGLLGGMVGGFLSAAQAPPPPSKPDYSDYRPGGKYEMGRLMGIKLECKRDRFGEVPLDRAEIGGQVSLYAPIRAFVVDGQDRRNESVGWRIDPKPDTAVYDGAGVGFAGLCGVTYTIRATYFNGGFRGASVARIKVADHP